MFRNGGSCRGDNGLEMGSELADQKGRRGNARNRDRRNKLSSVKMSRD